MQPGSGADIAATELLAAETDAVVPGIEAAFAKMGAAPTSAKLTVRVAPTLRQRVSGATSAVLGWQR
ncbi:hypothetical protein ABZW96_35740 [Nocardia sp. NPDC004168]|uniref:hypothetical protein n=1 Tax=Nocardia sp. NPDC004168 TaxID=3154452 RepID=UPI0033B607EE